MLKLLATDLGSLGVTEEVSQTFEYLARVGRRQTRNITTPPNINKAQLNAALQVQYTMDLNVKEQNFNAVLKSVKKWPLLKNKSQIYS